MEEQFHAELKSKTQLLHKLVEQTPISKAIISPELTSDQYKKYLQKLLCLHTGAEKAIFPVLSPYVSDIIERKKSDKILLDLKRMDFPAENCAIAFTDQHFISSVNFCFGIMYVLEGSTLGGMHILKNVQGSIGMHAEVPTNFLNAYGQYTGSKWKFFLEKLNNYQKSVNKADVTEIIDGAIYGFNKTHEIFNA